MLSQRDGDVFKAIVMPVYFCVDVSSSMHGSKIEALNSAIRDMFEHFANEMYAGVEFVFCVITFGDRARIHLPISKVYDLKWKGMVANGVTATGAALKQVKKMIEDTQTTPLKSYRPLIVLITDGAPTDSWEAPMDDFVKNGRSSKCDRMALAIGLHADKDVLNRFLENTSRSSFRARNVSQVHEFFHRIQKYLMLRATSPNPNMVPEDARLTPEDQNDFDNGDNGSGIYQDE